MRPALERQLRLAPARSGLAEGIRYALARWEALCRFLDDGHIELDTNTVERAIRPISLGRKNHIFAGSDGGADLWAVVATLITTAKLHDVEPGHGLLLTSLNCQIILGKLTFIIQTHRL